MMDQPHLSYVHCTAYVTRAIKTLTYNVNVSVLFIFNRYFNKAEFREKVFYKNVCCVLEYFVIFWTRNKTNKQTNKRQKRKTFVIVSSVYFCFQWISGLWDALWASLSKGRSCFQEMTVSFIYPRCTPKCCLLSLATKTEEWVARV